MTDKKSESGALTRRNMLAHTVQGAALAAVVAPAAAAAVPAGQPIEIDTGKLSLSVDPVTCRWSILRKDSPMRIDNVYFLPGNDPSGWTVSSSVNRADNTNLGAFVTVTLKGAKPGQLDFDYQISLSRTGDDVLVSLGRTNRTGHAVDIGDMDVFVSDNAKIGGATDRWISLGTHSRNRDYYELWPVQELVTPKVYAVNHLVRDADSGHCLLMGHITTIKGASRFEVLQGWQDKTQDRMQVRGYCAYKITMPDGASFPGEKLLIYFNTDGLRAMEHQGDLIALAHDVRLRERRPINLDDREWVSNLYCKWFGWMSGGNPAAASKFIEENKLADFYIGGQRPAGAVAAQAGARRPSAPGALTPADSAQGGFALYGSGGAVRGQPNRVNYPAECYLPFPTPRFGGERVIDFSNPLTQRLERERAVRWATTNPQSTGSSDMDFADWWDKWPGQHDPYMSSMETYHAGGLPWRDAIDKYAPRRTVRSNMNVIDHSYGIVDICRISSDADRGYEFAQSQLLPPYSAFLFSETVLGSANRFFYNGRVFWNDGDGFHVYKYVEPDGKHYTAQQAKVVANFRAIADNTILISEAFDEDYPPDRIELLKRISPPTMDVAYPVDLFVRQPAQVWNMPVERPFGSWNVIGVFNYTHLLRVEHLSNSLIQMLSGEDNTPFATELDAQKDLRLDPGKEYAVYEFWSRKLLGTFRGKFKPRPVKPYDCDIYSIVEVLNRPVLISTSRHIRQMAVDIKDLRYEGRALHGVSRSVPGDPYQLRFYVPHNFKAKSVRLSDMLAAELKTDGNLVTVDFTTKTDKDVEWRVQF